MTILLIIGSMVAGAILVVLWALHGAEKIQRSDDAELVEAAKHINRAMAHADAVKDQTVGNMERGVKGTSMTDGTLDDWS